jgi:hypothetical protein
MAPKSGKMLLSLNPDLMADFDKTIEALNKQTKYVRVTRSSVMRKLLIDFLARYEKDPKAVTINSLGGREK